MKKEGMPQEAIDKKLGELKPVPLVPGTEWLMQLFDSLNEKRDYYVITGMAGGSVIPKAISSLELAAHCKLYDLDITPWEAGTIDAMDSAYREESTKLRG